MQTERCCCASAKGEGGKARIVNIRVIRNLQNKFQAQILKNYKNHCCDNAQNHKRHMFIFFTSNFFQVLFLHSMEKKLIFSHIV